MQRNFYDKQQAQSYLSSSIVRLNGEPIYVTNIEGSGFPNCSLYYMTVGNQNKKGSCRLKDSALDFTPVPLGMMNMPAQMTGTIPIAVYCSRMPRRAWKVGLSSSALHLSITTVSHETQARMAIDRGRLMLSSAFRQLVVGNYPSFEKVVGRLEKAQDETSIAFSRRFALRKDNTVWYKATTEPVGRWTKNGITLNTKFQYLAEVLEEDMS